MNVSPPGATESCPDSMNLRLDVVVESVSTSRVCLVLPRVDYHSDAPLGHHESLDNDTDWLSAIDSLGYSISNYYAVLQNHYTVDWANFFARSWMAPRYRLVSMGSMPMPRSIDTET